MIRSRAGWLVILVMAPGSAAAHGGLPGGGGLYSGAAHPFLALEQFLALLSLGLLMGQTTGTHVRLPILFLAAGLGVGLAAGVVLDHASLTMLGLALVFGGLLAAARPLPVMAMAVCAAVAGWVAGSDTDVPAPASPDIVAAYAPFAGVFVGVFLICLNAAALSSVARRPVARIAIRVAGSWVAAIAVMVLALRLRPLAVIG